MAFGGAQTGGGGAATMTPAQASAKYGDKYDKAKNGVANGDGTFSSVGPNTDSEFVTVQKQTGGMDAQQYWNAVGQSRSEGIRSNPSLMPTYGDVVVRNNNYKPKAAEQPLIDTTTTVIPGTKDDLQVVVAPRKQPIKKPGQTGSTASAGAAGASSLLSSSSGGDALKSLLGQ